MRPLSCQCISRRYKCIKQSGRSLRWCYPSFWCEQQSWKAQNSLSENYLTTVSCTVVISLVALFEGKRSNQALRWIEIRIIIRQWSNRVINASNAYWRDKQVARINKTFWSNWNLRFAPATLRESQHILRHQETTVFVAIWPLQRIHRAITKWTEMGEFA